MKLRAEGAFFTHPPLARSVVEELSASPSLSNVYFDPMCGAGDLLLAIARKLPVAESLPKTLRSWGKSIAGCDKSAEFVRAARARLTLLAMQRCRTRVLPQAFDMVSAFPLVTHGDVRDAHDLFAVADHVLMNPPFGLTICSVDCGWGSGRVSSAAIFAEIVVRKVRQDTEIVAVLPDVLRSGARYDKWRRTIEGLALVASSSPYGEFGNNADVDVFLLTMKTRETKQTRRTWSWTDKGRASERVGDRFDIHVGAVVPHRDAKSGQVYRYVHARSLPPWKTKLRILEKRKFSGSVFAPPFVAVRRTSRPGRGRATATVVVGHGDVAVENHLLVLIPKDGSLKTCRELVRRLRLKSTDAWLNNRIRCRHLTTASLSDLPWWELP
jgi:hypothetical protein